MQYMDGVQGLNFLSAAGYIPFLVHSPASTSAVPVASYSDVPSGREVRKESTSNTERHKHPNSDSVHLP